MNAEPKFPTKIAVSVQIIGWIFIVWFLVNFFNLHSTHIVSDGEAFNAWIDLMKSAEILHLVLGIVLILNGVALSKIIQSLNREVERLYYQIKDTHPTK